MILYNTATSSYEEFVPHDHNKITMYVCGPTVYDRAHIGNARPAVVFDLLYRVLQYKYGNVNYARNFTDVDDKIIDRAITMNAGDINSAITQLTDKTIKWYHDDMEELNVILPTFEPRATQYIDQMIDMIKVIINRGHAYVSDNTVLFDVKSFPKHGVLSNRTIEDQLIGQKNETATYKKSPEDFVLWKPSDENQPSWPSPWGNGRPGWHIECSAMIRSLFGNHIDIHGGGIDLLFPHHENEHTQSCASCDDHSHHLAKYWVHNNFVMINNQKMSKSLGNFLTVNDLLQQGISGQTIRFVLLKTHYRQPLNWTDQSVIEAETILRKWNELTKDVTETSVTDDMISPLYDDLNMPNLITKMHEYAKNGEYSKLKAVMNFVGLKQSNIEIDISDLNYYISKLMTLRNEFKQKKQYNISDDIRSSLNEFGIEINDTNGSSVWSIKRKITNDKIKKLYNFYSEK